jgi:DNA-binding NarL/FixJ family response regulator
MYVTEYAAEEGAAGGRSSQASRSRRRESDGRKNGSADRLRVVIADDVDQSRAGLRALLETCARIEIVGEAADGEAALKAVEASKPDVVLMDLRMPRMDGLEATRQLKARWPDVRVVLLTIYACRRHEAADAGVDAFVVKGSPAHVLFSAVGPEVAC